MYDVIIAGGGIAGMSAALILGRCRRSVMLFDTGRPRNAASMALHGFLSRDGIPPLELRKLARDQLEPYPSVQVEEAEVIDAADIDGGYEVLLEDGRSARAKYLLIATGIVDRLPDIEGIEPLYGKNVFHCPYCDGWELRDQALAVFAQGTTGGEFAHELTAWSSDIILCTNGGPPPPASEPAYGHIPVNTKPIARLTPTPDGDIVLHFNDGTELRRRALFFRPLQHQASALAVKLGCNVSQGGGVEAGKFQQARPRLFVAGDAVRSIQLAIIAAAEGAEAAFAVNTALQNETRITKQAP